MEAEVDLAFCEVKSSVALEVGAEHLGMLHQRAVIYCCHTESWVPMSALHP
jgi:hypothetical protein